MPYATIMKKIKKIKINLNGKSISVPSDTTISNLIKKFKAQPNKIAIELNRKIIKKKILKKYILKIKIV